MNAKFRGIIFIECKTDKLLVFKMNFKKNVRCAGGIGEVCNKLKISENSCGLVDEDPTKPRPSYIENLLVDSIVSNNHDVIVAHDKIRNNYLIVLCPDRENWLIQTSKVLGIDLRDFNLPDDPKEFKKISIVNPKKIEPFIEALLNENHPRISELRKAFNYCKK